MERTIERLLKGDKQITMYYQRGKEIWAEILASPDAGSVVTLAKTLNVRQGTFERDCGGRWLGEEIMAVAALGQFYSTENGFGEQIDRALLVYKAIEASYCSIEVKHIARDVAESYGLLDEAETRKG